MCLAITGAVLCFGTVFAQVPSDDPFGGGFSFNYKAEVLTLGTQNDSLHSWAFAGEDNLVLIGDGSFPESYQCGENRDIAVGDFDGDFLDEEVVAWNRSDGGVFVGIPTIDPVFSSPDPAGWHLPDVPISSGVLYATPVLADVLGEIRVVAGNFYPDHAVEFVLAYLAADATVSLTIFDVDSTTSIPAQMDTKSDQAVNTDLPALQQFGAVSRFDIGTGDFDGDGLDEVALVVNDPAQSPATKLVLKIYDCDTLSHALIPNPGISFTANSDGNHTCLRSVLLETGNFEPDSLDEIAILDSWSRADVDSSRVGSLHTVKLTTAMTDTAASQTESLPPCSWHNDAGLNGPVHIMTTYNGELIVGGAFTAIGGFAANNIASWDGAHWKPLGAGVNDTVEALEVYEGDLIVGGSFTEAGGVPANRLARWDGSSWEEFGGGANNTVYDLLAPVSVSAGSLFACGDFTTVGGTSASRIARWDGLAWHTVGSGGGLNARALEMMEFGSVIDVTGYFQSSDPEWHYIAYWDPSNPNGWGYCKKGLWEPGHALADIYGSLIVGGAFTRVWQWTLLNVGSWQDANRIAFWTGSWWNEIGSGLNDLVEDLLFDDNTNNLYIGGQFTNAGTHPADRIARWHWPNAQPNDWSALGTGVTAATGTAEVVDMCFYGGELIAGGWFDHAGGIDARNIARWNQSLSQWHALSDSLPPMFSIGLAVGRFDADSKLDDIAITACGSDLGYVRRYLRVYGVDTLAAPLTLSEKGETNISGDWNVEGLARSRRLIAVDDITGDGQADLAVLSSQYPARIEIYEPCDAINNCTFDPMPQAGSWNSSSDNPTQLVLADLDTLTVTIAPPMAYHVDSVVQPLALIYAPPVHYDILDGTTWDVSKRYPLPPEANYDTYVEYFNSTGFVTTTETTVHRDWGVSVGLEGWATTPGGYNMSASLSAKYGDGFSKDTSHTETITVGLSTEARNDDQLHAVRLSYDILEYPVLRGGATKGHIVVLCPIVTSRGWSPAKDYEHVIPNHEVDNILSYPSPADILTNPMMGSGVIGNVQDFYTMQEGSRTTWYLGQTRFSESSVDSSWNVSVEVGGSFGWSGGTKIFGTGVEAGFEAKLDANYNTDQLSTFTTTFTETDSLRVQLGLINSSGSSSGRRHYEVTPYAYWANNGALVIDYAAKPVASPPGQDPTWWQNHYSIPDPAFVLPWRLDNEKYGAGDPEANRYRTKEITFIPSYPQPGDTVSIITRVHNFSLSPTSTPVKVSFYLGDPGNGGQILHDRNSGDSVFFACDTLGVPVPIKAQGWAIAAMVWQVPDAGSISSCQRIWALIDPGNEIVPEVHDNDDWATNNKGWKLLHVNTDEICVDRDGDGWADPAFRCNICPHEWDNCPTVYNPDQADSDGDGIGNACEAYMCGDANGDKAVNIGDAVFVINYIFKGGAAPVPVKAGDANCDHACNVGDAVYVVNYIFKGGPAPCCP